MDESARGGAAAGGAKGASTGGGRGPGGAALRILTFEAGDRLHPQPFRWHHTRRDLGRRVRELAQPASA